MGNYALGADALAICDICGLTYKYQDLQEVYRDRAATGLKACRPCYDPDHPQYRVGDLKISDAISLRDPRPDIPRAPFTDTVLTPPLSSLFIGQ